jgi:hypothetical protein
MRTLRLTQSVAGANRYRVEAMLEGGGQPHKVATAEFGFTLTAQDREDVRWYLEDYLQHAADPAPQIAARIESRIVEMGVELYEALSRSNDDAHALWSALRTQLNDTRIEIVTGVRDADMLPWELLRDPGTDKALALHAGAFVRATQQLSQCPRLRQSAGGRIRVLLVICRPGGSEDVPFRSVASRLIKGLGESARETFKLDVLRPPTFARLGDVLRLANAAGDPYHVVHFDGHGTYEDLNARYAGEPPKNLRGYLAFENAAFGGNRELVHGTILGSLLAETAVAVLVLNACRSAHAETIATPEKAQEEMRTATTSANTEIQEPARVFGSLAQEVVNAGVPGVVAMRDIVKCCVSEDGTHPC